MDASTRVEGSFDASTRVEGHRERTTLRYKSRVFRARAVREPRRLLREAFGLDISDDVAVRVHDSTADLRYIVVPRRPPGTEDWSERELAALVTRDTMIGTAEACVR